MSKLQKMQRFVPGLYKADTNPINRGLLYALSGEDDQIVAAAQEAKNQLFVKFAEHQYLDALGSNVGVFRPTAFNLLDEQFRQLIPAMSFYPKQVRPTIIAVLDVFFGENNPKVKVFEVNPNEIVIQIPSSVPALRRSIKGSNHLKAYTVTVNSINNTAKTMNVTMYGSGVKVLAAEELQGCRLGQGLAEANIIGNSAGWSGVTFQFSAGDDLSQFTVGKNAVIMNPNYQGAYIADPTRAYSVTKSRGVLGQNIAVGQIAPTLSMSDASNIPDTPGFVTFNFGFDNEEGPIRYFARPNNHTVKLDPGYNFTKKHSIGEVVNVVVTPYQGTDINGTDYRPYLVGVTAARVLAQQIVQSILAAGIVIRWVVVEPSC